MSEKYSAKELAVWSGGSWLGDAPGSIGGVSNDSRSIARGELYVAIKGDKYDGHDFVDAAFDNGACAALVDEEWAAGYSSAVSDRPLLVVSSVRSALLELARQYRRKVGLKLVAVTGSAGKSTVKEMTARILEKSRLTASTKGNWNNDIGLPMSVLTMDPGSEAGVFEAGTNHPGEIAVLAAVLEPDIAIITNVGPVHIEHFDSVDAIAEEKGSIIKSLSADGMSILNKDDDYFDYFLSRSACAVASVQIGGHANYVAVSADEPGSITILEEFSGEEVTFKPTLPGDHNLTDALLSVAAARALGADWREVKSALESFKPMPMRWELSDAGDVLIINDAYNANPLSMRASIGAFEKEVVAGGKWLVLSGMKELGSSEKKEHVSLGEYVGEGAWKGVVLVGHGGELIARGVSTTGYDKDSVYLCADNDEAAAILKENVRDGDAVLLKASRGMKLEEVADALKCEFV